MCRVGVASTFPKLSPVSVTSPWLVNTKLAQVGKDEDTSGAEKESSSDLLTVVACRLG